MADKKCHILLLPTDVLKIIITFVGAENVGSLFASCKQIFPLSRSYVPPLTPDNHEIAIMKDRIDLAKLFRKAKVSYPSRRGMLLDTIVHGSERIFREYFAQRFESEHTFIKEMRYAYHFKSQEIFEIINAKFTLEHTIEYQGIDPDNDLYDEYVAPCIMEYYYDRYYDQSPPQRIFPILHNKCQGCAKIYDHFVDRYDSNLDADTIADSYEIEFGDDPRDDMSKFKKPLPGIRRDRPCTKN